MRNLLLFSASLLLFLNCTKNISIENLSNKFNQNIEKIDKIQYDIERQKAFSDGELLHLKGTAILEKNVSDTILGFNFYGIRPDDNIPTIYNKGRIYIINNKNNTYQKGKGSLMVLGTSGGFMIFKDFFKLDSIYKNVKISETENSYTIKYQFKDDIKYKVTQKTKTIVLNKSTLLPKEIITTIQPNIGAKLINIYKFKNYKINNEIKKGINEYLEKIKNYSLSKYKKPKPNPILNKELPKIALKNILNENETIDILKGKLTLIEFWNVYCGYCLEAIPKVKKLKNKFNNKLNLVKILTNPKQKKSALKVINQEKIFYTNLIGNKNIIKQFRVNSYPLYFLIDDKGIIQKEYGGFSEQIEKDIEMISK